MNRVVVRKLELAKQSAGGIILPEASDKDLTTGKVISVGEGARNTDGTLRPALVQAGATVLLPKYGGQPAWLDSEKLFIYRDTEIVGVIKE